MLRMIGCVSVLVCLVQCKTASENKSAAAKHEAKREPLAVSYRLDPRLAGGTYGGERWISGPSFTSSAQPGHTAVVEARVAAARARWIAADPDLVIVSPVSAGRLDRVRITINKVGESRLTVTDGAAATELVVRGRAVGNAMQVEIAQIGETP